MTSDKFNLGLTAKHFHIFANIFLENAVVHNTRRSTCENNFYCLLRFKKHDGFCEELPTFSSLDSIWLN